MNISHSFSRLFFTLLSLALMTVYMTSGAEGATLPRILKGLSMGGGLSLLLIGSDLMLRRYNLRSFNIALVGLFVGYLMGKGLVLLLNTVLDISTLSIHLNSTSLETLRISFFLFGAYLGLNFALRSSDEFYMSIPFVKFSALAQKKKDILIDASVIGDPRIIDLCATGLLDHYLVLPRFVLKELYSSSESGDEATKQRSKTALETVKKLEEISHLHIRYHDTDFPEVAEMTGKLVRLARLIDGNILTGDISRIQIASYEGVKIINIHSLSNALKPLMEAGEIIHIKIQRFGKEPRQGVGYLDDGTMVVVNGGGDFVGETIKAQVLSVKHTSSGRMIFSNAAQEEALAYQPAD